MPLTARSLLLPNRDLTIPCSQTERVVAAVALLAVLIVRVVFVFRLQVDSDEPQHLHVAWQWSQGLISYRDFFDNHTPLFHILMAPVMKCLGEHADILGRARLFMVPLYLVSLWAVWRLGRALFSERIGLWAPVFAAAYPKYLYPAVEFRADNLWAPLWLASLAVLFSGRPSVRRSFAAGLLAGITLSASMKTGLLAGSLTGAAIVILTFADRIRADFNPAKLAANLASGLAGAAIVPGLLLVFFVRQGALAQMNYCIFLHNILPAGIVIENRPPSWVMLAFAFLFLIIVSFGLFRLWGANGVAFRRTVLFLHAGFIMAILKLVWPVATRQNDLPVYPVMILFLSVPVVSLAEQLAPRFPGRSPTPLLGCVAAGMLAWVTFTRPITVNRTLSAEHLITDALRLTAPGEYIMTYKGEAVFRPRPYYYVLETFTRARLSHGLLPDEIADRLVATRTCVVMTLTHRLPLAARRFIEDNYLPVGQLRVVGQELPEPDSEGNIRFNIAIPADYTLLPEAAGPSGVRLDGRPFNRSAHLEAGEHVLRIDGNPGHPVLLWTRAVERGFKPLPRDFQPEYIGTEF